MSGFKKAEIRKADSMLLIDDGKGTIEAFPKARLVSAAQVPATDKHDGEVLLTFSYCPADHARQKYKLSSLEDRAEADAVGEIAQALAIVDAVTFNEDLDEEEALDFVMERLGRVSDALRIARIALTKEGKD